MGQRDAKRMAELTFLISEFESREFAKQCKRFRNYLKNSLDSGRFLAIIYTYFYILFNGSYTFYDLLISPEKLATEAGKMNLATMSAGSFEFVVVPDKKITLSPDELSGNFTMVGSSDYEYSPTAVMNDELEATKHYFMSLSRVYRLVINVVVGLILFLLGCLIMYLVHRHQIKKGHPPFSKWYVIVPYLIVIAGLTVLTAMLSYHLFVVDMARIISASFTVLLIFLLSLRGTLRYPRKSSILLTTCLFTLFAITFLFFDRTEKISFSWVLVTVFALVIGLLSAAAVLTFREPSGEKASVRSSTSE